MSAHYFKCYECDSMFVRGSTLIPENLVCVMGRCDIKEITREEADRLTEEMRDEQKN